MERNARYWKTLPGLLATTLAAGSLIGCGGKTETPTSNPAKPAVTASDTNTVDTKGQVPDPESPNPTGTGGSVNAGGGNTGGPGGRTSK